MLPVGNSLFRNSDTWLIVYFILPSLNLFPLNRSSAESELYLAHNRRGEKGEYNRTIRQVLMDIRKACGAV
jgi:hypothetical protein